MTAILLPPPSPALIVHEAAAVIRQTAVRASAEMATNSYWGSGWEAGVTDALGSAAGELAALFTPALALQFADWLDEAASANARHGTPLPPLALTAAHTVTRHPALEGATT